VFSEPTRPHRRSGTASASRRAEGVLLITFPAAGAKKTLLAALVVFRLLPGGFVNRDLRALLACLLGVVKLHHYRLTSRCFIPVVCTISNPRG
jgi:hypothetical protein